MLQLLLGWRDGVRGVHRRALSCVFVHVFALTCVYVHVFMLFVTNLILINFYANGQMILLLKSVAKFAVIKTK